MSKAGLPIEDKLEAIGYLAVAGVISSIEATVPYGKEDAFRDEFDGMYSDEYPYSADKRGYQFRIYLNDIDGCPDCLADALDETYNNRINDTRFVRDLVLNYGFRFTKEPQDSAYIRECVINNHGRRMLRFFEKGFNAYQDFIVDIEDSFWGARSLPVPNILEYKKKNISRIAERRNKNNSERDTAFTPKQMLNLGWLGESYIAFLLGNHDIDFLDSIGIPDVDYDIHWFNEGFENSELDENNERIWLDKSVGHGCDIIVSFDDETYYIEVKTSKREYPYFKMTSAEMQVMEEQLDNYILVKVNNFERLLHMAAPDVIPIVNPYRKLFHPKQMKEATFIIGGE